MAITVNLLRVRAGNTGCLTAEDTRFAVLESGPEKYVPGRCDETVPVALSEVLSIKGITNERFFQNLRLFALMMHVCQ
ncbi:hypothetical protein ALP75_200597 [Pseudomonas syringae pv. actinidiae]|nr:hypothetical protein ALP75_200597 [Pseudomonas syringae pv. actinidiae]